MQKQILLPVTIDRETTSTLMVQFCRIEYFELINYTVELVRSHFRVSHWLQILKTC